MTRLVQGHPAAVPALERALGALLREEGLTDIRWLWLGCHTAMDLWDDQTCRELGARHARLARQAGALTMLPIALSYLAAHHIFAGELTTAAALLEEADVITAATGNAPMADFSLLLAAWRGQASSQFDAAIQDAAARGEGLAIAGVQFAAAVLHNGLGRYPAALAAAQQARDHDELGFGVWVLPELIEAAARSGQPEAAADGLRELSERTSLSRRPWAHGIQARSRALLTSGPAAGDLYQEAISLIGPSQMTVQLARTHLLYGEWLRRENRRTEARGQLRTAHQMLAAMGAGGFAERAACELLATGERVRNRTTDPPARLTPRETQIGRARRRRPVQPRDRRPAVHEPAHRRIPPAQDLHQARRQLPQPAPWRPGRQQKPRTAANLLASICGVRCRGGTSAPAHSQGGGSFLLEVCASTDTTDQSRPGSRGAG